MFYYWTVLAAIGMGLYAKDLTPGLIVLWILLALKEIKVERGL